MDTTGLAPAALAALHRLRVRGMEQGEPAGAVADLVSAGLARRAGRFTTLTEQGRALAAAAARLPEGSAETECVAHGYHRFLPLNEQALARCTAWQLRPDGSPNDHSDGAYDDRVVRDLEALHESVAPVIRAIAAADARFAAYEGRLGDALDRVRGGDREWFASPRVDSYHTVWMQLHEELLLALGVDRAAEHRPS